MIILIVNDRR